jgi:hypothetical protein
VTDGRSGRWAAAASARAARGRVDVRRLWSGRGDESDKTLAEELRAVQDEWARSGERAREEGQGPAAERGGQAGHWSRFVQDGEGRELRSKGRERSGGEESTGSGRAEGRSAAAGRQGRQAAYKAIDTKQGGALSVAAADKTGAERAEGARAEPESGEGVRQDAAPKGDGEAGPTRPKPTAVEEVAAYRPPRA